MYFVSIYFEKSKQQLLWAIVINNNCCWSRHVYPCWSKNTNEPEAEYYYADIRVARYYYTRLCVHQCSIHLQTESWIPRNMYLSYIQSFKGFALNSDMQLRIVRLNENYCDLLQRLNNYLKPNVIGVHWIRY